MSALDLTELQPLFTCKLCKGLLRYAHTLAGCLHTFCSICILQNKIRGSIDCPTCIELSIIHSQGHVQKYPSQVIYDQKLQAVVDKIFQKSAKQDQVKSPQVQPTTRKRARILKPVKEQKAKKSKPQEARVEVLITLAPETNCDPALILPALPRPSFLGGGWVKIIKIQSFISKRIGDGTLNIHKEDISIIYQGRVLKKESSLDEYELHDFSPSYRFLLHYCKRSTRNEYE
jgi:hypothetical protein